MKHFKFFATETFPKSGHIVCFLICLTLSIFPPSEWKIPSSLQVAPQKTTSCHSRCWNISLKKQPYINLLWFRYLSKLWTCASDCCHCRLLILGRLPQLLQNLRCWWQLYIYKSNDDNKEMRERLPRCTCRCWRRWACRAGWGWCFWGRHALWQRSLSRRGWRRWWRRMRRRRWWRGSRESGSLLSCDNRVLSGQARVHKNVQGGRHQWNSFQIFNHWNNPVRRSWLKKMKKS